MCSQETGQIKQILNIFAGFLKCILPWILHTILIKLNEAKAYFCSLTKFSQDPIFKLWLVPGKMSTLKCRQTLGKILHFYKKNIQRCHIRVLVNVLTQLLPSPLNMQNMWCYCLMIFSFISFFFYFRWKERERRHMTRTSTILCCSPSPTYPVRACCEPGRPLLCHPLALPLWYPGFTQPSLFFTLVSIMLLKHTVYVGVCGIQLLCELMPDLVTVQ